MRGAEAREEQRHERSRGTRGEEAREEQRHESSDDTRAERDPFSNSCPLHISRGHGTLPSLALL
jgi:hypothetical protein